MTNSQGDRSGAGGFDRIRTLLVASIASGATVKSVQRMLGHAAATLTLDHYGHLFADELDDVAARLDDAMRENDVVPMWSRADPSVIDDDGQGA